MDFDPGAAALAGLLAGVVMIATRLVIRAAGVDLRMDVLRMWSTMFRIHGAPGRWFGMGMHLLVSVVVGVVYALGLRYLFNATDAYWLWGLLGAAIHYVIAGAFLTIAPEMNPEMPQRIPAPGPFATKLGGADVGGFLAGHLTYGVSFAILYALLHPAGGASVAF
ncbi:MAG: hypothetical protein M3295_02535 [Chloroflexota bacterium]|nr:hypothetical protein [Chloroflexota bacterium]